MADNGYPVSHRFQVNVEVSIPQELVVEAVSIIMKDNDREEPHIYANKEGMKVATEFMRKEEARVKVELKALTEHFAPRIARGRIMQNETVNLLIERYEESMKECHSIMDTLIGDLLINPHIKEYMCEDMDKIEGIVACVNKNTAEIQKRMNFHVRLVVKCAAGLSYELELLHH